MSAASFPQPAARLCGVTALACLLVLALMVVIGGALTPGYSHTSQFISELGARGAPLEQEVRFAGFLPLGVLMLAFCVFSFLALPRSAGCAFALAGLAIYAAGYLVAVAFPCELGCRPEKPSAAQLIHNALGLLGYLLAPAFLLAFAIAARAWPGARRLSAAGYVAAALALVGLAMLMSAQDIVGAGQRLLEFSVLAWVAWCGVYTARHGTRTG